MSSQGVDADGIAVAEEEPVDRPSKKDRSGGSRSSSRRSPIAYIKSVIAELKKVHWPTRSEVRNYSLVVFFTLVVLIALIFVLDYAFSSAAVFLFK